LNISALEIKELRLELNVKSAVLMDASTGTVLYSLNMDEALPPASVTKIMTLLLTFEALDRGTIKLEEMLTVSEHASSMGGSQVYLEPGENMNVDELLKCVIIASANDAALTLAERVAGSEEAFVSMMNSKAKDLGMKNSNFENVTGLDDETINHTTSAYDIALMSRELLKHKDVQKYTTIWMDTLRNGNFQLANTNKLIRFYKGATGLKTGSTSLAGCCISASAKRDGMHLIAVVMGANNSKDRFLLASELLNHGFANYATTIFGERGSEVCDIPVKYGKSDFVIAKTKKSTSAVVNKEQKADVRTHISIPEHLKAPVKKGAVIGELVLTLDGETLSQTELISDRDVKKKSAATYFAELLKGMITPA
jgi:D-alanyl-D-alanine carboxypeptidase (penicillin-binding protein 5/6)